ncbi:MAG: hypothetical protein RLZZ323_567 [Bacteroidota bacterium]|jgi:hypothetical protein
MKRTLLFILIGFPIYSQQLHHQMLSSQGVSNTLLSGVKVSQTVGQQSVIGNYNFPTTIVSQGFQKNLLSKSDVFVLADKINTIVYPNPFVDQIHFHFSKPLNGLISITIFDILGRLVYKDQKEVINNTINIDNLQFPDNEYLVKLSGTNFNYSTQLIKSK